MPEFKGFDDWVPIFRGGRQRDSQGHEHDGDALIDQAVSKFNAAVHEPPACVGHPADNKPAYGWVRGLKKGVDKFGNVLLAKFGQVEPTFSGMVAAGRFKKRSAAFYPDGSLRHVAFLGAAPPAVKGLPDMAFAEEAGATFEFGDYQTVWSWEAIAALFGRLRDYLIEKDGVEKADAVISQYQIKEISDAAAKEKQEIQNENAAQAQPIYHEKEAGQMDFKEFIQKLKELVLGAETSAAAAAPAAAAAGKTFSEADLTAQVKTATEEAARKEREKVTAEFAERERTTRQDARRKEVTTWCDTQVKAGRLTPAMVKFGIPEMLLAFAEKDEPIEFGETKEKATLFDRFKGLIETELPKVVTFNEVAGRDRDTGGQGADGGKLESLIQAKMKETKELSYSAAFAEVQRENPDLARQYAAEFKEV
jgi:hypothetical protein